MRYSKERLAKIHASTNGRCHICHEAVALDRYGDTWEVDHSVARACGGTERLNNLRPAHIPCNRSKRDGSTRAARARHGYSRAPMSSEQQERKRASNTAKGAGIGGGVAGLLAAIAGGPVGLAALAGAGIGALVGHASDVELKPER
ncbi:MAG TPA: HNH endonuclease signature motif containing protein [Polyangia bacterium]|jgi:hypothetical protein